MKEMPDLFVVMSDEELAEAIELAKQRGAKETNILENISYRLIFNGTDAIKYCSPVEGWFPMFTDYLSLKTADGDEIAILLSPTVWPDYSLAKVRRTLDNNGIRHGHLYDPYVDNNAVSEIKEKEKIFSKNNPVNSPWTARDIEVAMTGVDTIENITSATLIVRANVQITCFITMITGMGPYDMPAAIFYYPNVLHLVTDSGYYNVFLGEQIDLEALTNYTQEKIENVSIEEFSPEIASWLLFPSRYRTSNNSIETDENQEFFKKN